MKKITLGLFALLASAGVVRSQTNLLVEAPYSNSTTQLRLPCGPNTQAFMRGCYLVTAAELSALTGTNITSLGFEISAGTGGTAVSGNFTVYIQNTTDVAYLKGTNYAAAITGMSTVYNGNMTIPAGTGTANITLPLSPTFTYTGGGLYIAYDWASVGPFSTNYATYYANNTPGVTMGCTDQAAVAGPAPTTLTNAEYRPVFRFAAANTATNEVSVTNVIAPGKVAKSVNAGHVIKALVKNGSINSLSNITVSLAVSGANTFANTQTIASLAAGSTATVSFASFNPSTQGTNSVTVSVPADQNNGDNQMVWTQSVTCNILGNNPPSGTYPGSVGFPNSSGIIATIINLGSTNTLTAVRLVVGTSTTNLSQPVFGALLDASGNVLATTNTLNITAAMQGTFTSFHFSPAQVLSANTDYYVGLGQPQSGYYPIGYQQSTTLAPGLFFGTSLTGGTFNPSNFGYYGIEPVLGPDVNITRATDASSVICKGETAILLGSGATTYTWSGGTGTNTVSAVNGSSVSVSPQANVTYILKGTDAAGCTNSVSITQSVAACAGIYANAVKDAKIQLYPNPAVGGKTAVTGLEGTNTIAVFNMLGQVIITKVSADETVDLDLADQPFGNYLVKITDANNHVKTLKFVNQN